MAATGRVQRFLEEARVSLKRPAGVEQPEGVKRQACLLLPVTLQLDTGHRETPREQVLWRLGDAKAVPAVAARAFAQQHMQGAQLEQETQRIQKEIEKVLQQHADVASAPSAPTLVKLEVRADLPHLRAVFLDEPLWDLSAPRAACEAYISQVCNELRLDWAAHTLIMRRMKDAIDAASRDLAAGKAQVVPCPAGAALRSSTPSRWPEVLRATQQQRTALRQLQEKRRGEGGTSAAGVKTEGGEAAGDEAAGSEAAGGEAATAPAVKAEAGVIKTEAEAEELDMPDLPVEDS